MFTIEKYFLGNEYVIMCLTYKCILLKSTYISLPITKL